MKTYRASEKDFNRQTYLIDASGKTLGRLATKVASLLIGKGKTFCSPDQLLGDRVIVIHADKIHLTGRKKETKVYTHYTGFASGMRTARFSEVTAKKPEEVILRAVSRMLPKNKLGAKMLKALRVFSGAKHIHPSSKPIPAEV